MTDARVITPAATDEEAVAIAAAIEALWPTSAVMAAIDDDDRPLAWRFSGRWWQRDRMAHADRPWR
jgi:hypothetical protein